MAVAAQVIADRRGHGFLSSVDAAETLGDKVEVYTLIHDDTQATGTIGLALDYETRGETPSGATCGNGSLAEIDFQVVVLPRWQQAGAPERRCMRGCGRKLAADVRFNQAALPGLRIRR